MHPYPMVRSGGLFVFFVGAGIALGALFGKKSLVPLLVTGGAAAVISQIVLGRRLTAPLGEPTFWQNLALIGAIVLEMIAVGVVAYVFREAAPRTFWLWILLAVGFHLFIIAIAQGPALLLLGLLCVLNAFCGLRWRGIPFSIFWFIDGALKMIVGGWMFWRMPG